MNSQSNKNKSDERMYQKILVAAEFYYLYKFSQEEISKRMGISRPWVSKLLKRAEEIGIVKVEVLTPSAGITQIEDQLKEKYNIASCKVVRKFSSANILTNVGKAAANYILSVIQPKDIIGVSWGRTLAAVADEFVEVYYPDVSVIPIIGGLGIDPELLSNQVATKMANTLGAHYALLHAPAFTTGKKERDVFLNEPSIKSMIEKCDDVTIAVTGLGSLRGSTMHMAGYISEQEISELEELGVVGDIALRFIDCDGTIVSHPILNRLVASDLNTIRKKAKQIIGVASGINKVTVIDAALKGKWLDALITDFETASELLK